MTPPYFPPNVWGKMSYIMWKSVRFKYKKKEICKEKKIKENRHERALHTRALCVVNVLLDSEPFALIAHIPKKCVHIRKRMRTHF